jgi:hypothetical protein
MASKDSIKIKLDFSRNTKIMLLVLALIILAGFIILSGTIYDVFYEAGVNIGIFPPKPITSWNYYGQILNFRADLREADEISVYPNENAIFLDLVHALAKNVTLTYKYINEPTSANSYYTVQMFQIVRNIIPAYEHFWKFRPEFNFTEVDSYENLPGKIQNPIIAIVPPPYSNETAIKNEGHVTYLKAETYEDLDLVVTKLLMIALKIDLGEAS